MKIIALLIASLMILLGLTGVLWPERLMGLANYSFTATGIYVVAIVRMAIGLLLVFAAKATRTPKTVRAIALIILAAGIATALITVERTQLLRDWWLGRGPDAFRIAACLPLAVGFFVAGSTLTKERTRNRS
jgi:ABC-type uncharacterized transport system permease subunit